MDPTTKFSVYPKKTSRIGEVADLDGRWVFKFDPSQIPQCSSGGKRVFEGRFSRKGEKHDTASKALVYSSKRIDEYGHECRVLGELSALGVGPKLLAVSYASIDPGSHSLPVLLEENAGLCLATLISREDVEGDSEKPPVLHRPGSDERKQENLKIMFDLYSQIVNAHAHNIYHRDLRCENVCIRRFGALPADIKATIIDFDLGGGISDGTPRAHASLYDALFRDAPTHINGHPTTIRPNALELDLAYLSAIAFHLDCGELALNSSNVNEATIASYLEFIDKEVDYFGYSAGGLELRTRRITREFELAPLARLLSLVPVNKHTFVMERLLAEAKLFHREYLDREEQTMLEESAPGRISGMIEELAKAKFETYKELRRSQGQEVEYEKIEDQPLDLQESNLAQVAHIPAKVEALGYIIAPLDAEMPGERVTEFTREQVEFLANLEHERWMAERRASGWSEGPRNHANKTTPYFVPYSELEDEVKEYDRDAVRQVIPLLERIGLGVVKPI